MFSRKNTYNFRSPLGIPILLSGNFGIEIQPFSYGLDIKTNGRINYRIYSIDTGFVSELMFLKEVMVKLYVDHPNGFTSVYAHLDHFPEKIEKILRNRQYELQTETLTYYLDSLEMSVSKGEIVHILEIQVDLLDLTYISKSEKLNLNTLSTQSCLILIL